LTEIAYRHGAQTAKHAMLLRAAMAEKMPDAAQLETILRAASKIFPITSADLRPALEGPALGARLAELEARWIASDFTLGKVDLLSAP
jgi:hypothetical protein